MKRLTLLLAGLLALPAGADWHFAEPVDVSGPRSAFHHIEASGRQALAVSGNRIAVAWEDDRDGTPRCRIALRAGDNAFREYVFGQGECYAPGVTALPDGRFAAIWEDEAGVAVAPVGTDGPGTVVRLDRSGGQGALAWHPELGLLAVWSAPDGRWRRLWSSRIVFDGSVPGKHAVDAEALRDDQLYPALAADTSGYLVAWEDRRLGHTVIFAARSGAGESWSAPKRVSQNQTGRAQGTDLGRGTGAMRPALAVAAGRATAVWLDKRDFLSGYDVYAASADADGFGRNAKVQDSFGDAIAQWHPAVAGNTRGDLAVAWDDDRDGNPDIWLSWPGDSGYADNVAIAAGPNAQSDPALALDDAGRLHAVWVERLPDGRSGLRYRLGVPAP